MLKVPDVIVETDWLYEHRNHPDLIILDATIKKVTSNESAKINKGYIPRSIFFDLKNTFSDQESILPNTILSFSKFEEEAQKLGINKDSCIVVYDDLGIYSSPRVFWLFRTMGLNNIAVLNGGLTAWIEDEHLLVEERDQVETKGDFKTNYTPEFFSSVSDVRNALSKNEISIIDARREDRFSGLVDEPRKGLRSGHIPSSLNIPYTKVLRKGKLASKDTLEKVFKVKEEHKKKIIFSCGSGITACVLALATEYIGSKNYSVYDGSWTEWGSDINLPIEK